MSGQRGRRANALYSIQEGKCSKRASPQEGKRYLFSEGGQRIGGQMLRRANPQEGKKMGGKRRQYPPLGLLSAGFFGLTPLFAEAGLPFAAPRTLLRPL